MKKQKFYLILLNQFQQGNDSSEAAVTDICNEATRELTLVLSSKSQLIVLTEGQEIEEC